MSRCRYRSIHVSCFSLPLGAAEIPAEPHSLVRMKKRQSSVPRGFFLPQQPRLPPIFLSSFNSVRGYPWITIVNIFPTCSHQEWHLASCPCGVQRQEGILRIAIAERRKHCGKGIATVSHVPAAPLSPAPYVAGGSRAIRGGGARDANHIALQLRPEEGPCKTGNISLGR